MSEGCNNPLIATPRPWRLATNDPTIIVTERLDDRGDCFVVADVLNGMRHSTKEDELNAALIVHAVNNIDRITAERDGLRKVIENAANRADDYFRINGAPVADRKPKYIVQATLWNVRQELYAALTPSVPDRTIDNTPSCGMENDFRRATSADTDAVGDRARG